MDCGFCTRKTAAENKFRAAEVCVLLSENAGSKNASEKEDYETAYDRKREPCKSCDFSANGRCQRPAISLLCHEQGAGMVCSEMISAKAILYHNKIPKN